MEISVKTKFDRGSSVYAVGEDMKGDSGIFLFVIQEIHILVDDFGKTSIIYSGRNEVIDNSFQTVKESDAFGTYEEALGAVEEHLNNKVQSNLREIRCCLDQDIKKCLGK